MTHSQIEQLLARFLDGQTSEAEEKFLCDYFREAEDVPEEWKAYQDMFASFDTDAFDFSDEELDRMCSGVDDDGVGVDGSSVENDDRDDSLHSRFFVRWRMGAAAAALLLGVVGTAVYMLSDRFSDVEAMDIEASAPDSVGESVDSFGMRGMKRSVAFVDETPMHGAAATGDAVQKHVAAAEESGVGGRDLAAAEVNRMEASMEEMNDTRMSGSMIDIPDFDGIMAEVRRLNERVDACMQGGMEVALSVVDEAPEADGPDENSVGVSSCGCPIDMSDEIVKVAAFPRIP